MPILRAVINQQQQSGGGNTLTEQREKRLGLAVQPVQILKDEDQGLVETLADQQALERLKGAPPPHLGVFHQLRHRSMRIGHPEQRQQVGQDVFQTAVQREHLAQDLLAPAAVIILGGNLEVALEQLNQRQIG